MRCPYAFKTDYKTVVYITEKMIYLMEFESPRFCDMAMTHFDYGEHLEDLKHPPVKLEGYQRTSKEPDNKV